VPLTLADRVPPTVLPVNRMSDPSNPVTSWLKRTSNVIGAELAGSACPAPCSIVTVGAAPKLTVLSLEVEAPLALPTASDAAPATTLATTSPLPDMPVTETV
jgi:hypothetical protein